MTFFTLYARNVRQFPRIPTVLVFGIVMPIIQLGLLGSVFSKTIDLPGHPLQGSGLSYYTFIAPSVILLTAFIGMANSSAAFIVDLHTGYFDKLRTTPASANRVVAARLLAETTRVSAQGLMVLLVAILIGSLAADDASTALPETGVLGALVMILAAVLFSTMTTGMFSMLLAMKTRSDQATQAVFPLFFLLLFLSTAFMPANLLPSWLEDITAFNPVDYMINGLRALMLDGWSEALPDLAIGLGIAAVIGGILAAVNVGIYKRMLA